ncbi:MAG: hypothetical protein KGL10_00510 [Alphaproteobacteria bacterium]|nr:hypothetical protein [Alphaproteobacteria bacterium]MDE2335774.1 hypothetical protein [Alphaproteobacteria bacterium]
MKKELAIMAVAMTLYGAAAARAQEPAQMSPPSPAGPSSPSSSLSAAQQPPLEDRFAACLKEPACSAKDRLALLKEMNVRLGEQIEIIDRACSYLDYKNCVDPQQPVVQAWHKEHDDMQNMMLAMESQSLGEKKPSAGGSVTLPEKWWQRIWSKY